MQREGSAFQGLGVVMLKELADHLTSIRLFILELLVCVIAMVTVFFGARQIKDDGGRGSVPVPEVLHRFPPIRRRRFIFWLDLAGAGNGDRPGLSIQSTANTIGARCRASSRSRSIAMRCCSENFSAALMTLAIALVVLWLLVIGLGLLFIGIPPGGEEIARAFVFLLVTIVYAGVWLGACAAVLDSVPVGGDCGAGDARSVAFPLRHLAGAGGRTGADFRSTRSALLGLGLQTPGTVVLQQILARFSPSTLFGEIVVAILDPTTRALGPIYLSQLQGAVLGAPLPLGASVLIAWPQIVGLVATAILLFVIGYVVFQRQEVRA